MRCSAVSLVGGGDQFPILPSPGRPVLPQPARKPWPGPPRALSASQDPGLQPAQWEGRRCVVWVAGEHGPGKAWPGLAVTGGLGRGPQLPLSCHPPVAPSPILGSGPSQRHHKDPCCADRYTTEAQRVPGIFPAPNSISWHCLRQ